MSPNEIAAIAIGIGVLVLVLIRALKVGNRYRDASESEGSMWQRTAARYFRDREPLELITLAATPVLFIFFLWLWAKLSGIS